MERLAYAITDHLLRRDVIQKEDYDIYVYGYAVFLEQMCQVIGFILLGIVTKNLLQTALFLGTFYLIRSAFGGYHAETSPVCMLVSYGGWGAVMILSRYMEAYAEVPLVLWIVLAADLCVFAILGPVAHANKPLTAVQKKRNKSKRISRFRDWLFAGISLEIMCDCWHCVYWNCNLCSSVGNDRKKKGRYKV